MDVNYERTADNLTVYVYGELDECSAPQAKNVIDKLLEDNLTAKSVIFDLSGLTFMDSTGIGLLIGRYKKLSKSNVKSFITGASVSAEKVIEVAGLYKIMPKF